MTQRSILPNLRNSAAARGLLACALGAPLFCGCVVNNMTNPARSASEELVLSTAADRAIASAPLGAFNGKRVYLDSAYFDSIDSKYVIGQLRDSLSRAGAFLVGSPTNSEIVLEARSGGYSTDSGSTLIGLANTAVPIPLAGTVPIPEIALYKSAWQNAYAKFALLAYDTHSLGHLYSSGPLVGKSYNKTFKLLFIINWTGDDIPEKKAKDRVR